MVWDDFIGTTLKIRQWAWHSLLLGENPYLGNCLTDFNQTPYITFPSYFYVIVRKSAKSNYIHAYFPCHIILNCNWFFHFPLCKSSKIYKEISNECTIWLCESLKCSVTSELSHSLLVYYYFKFFFIPLFTNPANMAYLICLWGVYTAICVGIVVFCAISCSCLCCCRNHLKLKENYRKELERFFKYF